jgi:hypothetical protein
MNTSAGRGNPCQSAEDAYNRAFDAWKQKQDELDLVNDKATAAEMKRTRDNRGKKEWQAAVSKLAQETSDAAVALDKANRKWIDCRRKYGLPVTSFNLYWQTVGELQWLDDNWVHTGIHITDDGAFHNTEFRLSWLDDRGWQEEKWESLVFYPAGDRTLHGMIQNGAKDIELGPQAVSDRRWLREIAQQQSGLKFQDS